MRPETYDFLGNLNAMWTVLLGALLATGGGFGATLLERYLERRARERNAALLFAEVLSMIDVILKMTHSTYGRGDPFGPVTLRILRSVQHEIGIYDRNRESLYDIRDAALRAKIHSTVLRLAMPIDGVFDTTQEMTTVQGRLKTTSLSAQQMQELEERVAELRARRVASYEFVRETAEELRPLIKNLEPVARQSFERHLDAVQAQSGIVLNTLDTTP